MNNKKWLKNLLLDILYPKFCVNCKKEGFYLCEDCLSLIEILEFGYCPFCFPPKINSNGKTCPICAKKHYLDGLYFACSYENPIIKKLIHEFKYSPFVKDYSELLAFFIISHLANLKKNYADFSGFIVIPVPLFAKKQKARGYNQAEEIAKNVSEILKLQLISNILVKTKPTISQTELEKNQRIENIKNSFSISKNWESSSPNSLAEKKILLVDDVVTTGATMDECARVLKQVGAKEVWGMAVARGS